MLPVRFLEQRQMTECRAGEDPPSRAHTGSNPYPFECTNTPSGSGANSARPRQVRAELTNGSRIR